MIGIASAIVFLFTMAMIARSPRRDSGRQMTTTEWCVRMRSLGLGVKLPQKEAGDE